MQQVLMNGTGVGFSVERQYVQNIPVINDEFYETDTVIIVSDSIFFVTDLGILILQN